VPVVTEFGKKRQIDQSSCNKDFSCLKGFCPSFVTISGAELKKPAWGEAEVDEGLPEPMRPALEGSFGIVVAGIGGTGVVTIGNLLGMAAHLEGKGAAGLDMTGLAQKGGAVLSHLRIAPSPADIRTTRIAPGGARLLIGADLVVATSRDALGALDPRDGHAVVSDREVMTGEFTHNADFDLPVEAMKRLIRDQLGTRATFLDAQALAIRHLGDALASNLLMVGIAYQKGLLPLSAAAIERAIELNGTAVPLNRAAFRLGRRVVLEPDALARPSEGDVAPYRRPSRDLAELIARRADYLEAYQDRAYAQRYLDVVERVRAAEEVLGARSLTEAVARYYFKLLAYKDEYEVARLYAETGFVDRVRRQFEPGGRIEIHLASPILAKRDPHSGLPVKRTYGPWMFRIFKVLARLKGLRGTPFDPFGRTAERRLERRLIGEYEAVVDELLENLRRDTHELAVEIARLPEQIRGFGHVRLRHAETAKAREAELLSAFRAATQNRAEILTAAE
jgi:indolepyruvate ferredoxin oxidoreductase